MLGIVRQTLKSVGNHGKDGVKIVKMVPAKGHHRCHCAAVLRKGLIATFSAMTAGTLFGHSFYSDL